METNMDYSGGENFDLHTFLLSGKTASLKDKTALFENFTDDLLMNKEMLCRRCITSAADREVEVADEYTGRMTKMLMFGSNNYLGLANHPYVKAKAAETILKFGAGIGGPPLLNGYTSLHKQLEERLAALKGAEDALIFSSGYGANVGLITGLMNSDSIILYDAFSHASLCDGIKMSGARSFRFPHNNLDILERKLRNLRNDNKGDIYVAVEGVYSMDGDTAPLDKLVLLCKKYNAYLIVDDAHGTGVMGKTGKGTAEYFNVSGKVDITMGTFSKAFSVTGGFIAGPKSIINYLRYFARAYMFSASLPPVIAAIVLAGLDLLEKNPEQLSSLKNNIKYAAKKLNELGFAADDVSPIFPIVTPLGMNIRKASFQFHQAGIFVNSIEYPAVPLTQQRFRISIMAVHTREDIERLVETIKAVFNNPANYAEGRIEYAAA